MKNLKEWFAIRPAISVRHIEIEAGIPKTSLDKFLRGIRPLPSKYNSRLLEVLKWYGIEECETCECTGEVYLSCCGDDIRGNDIDLCPTCFEHCGHEPEDCIECGGKGWN